jgi:REP element-mobilizing transposase RayT
MTQARRQLVNPNYAGTYHCINRCVRRSWLCGFDTYSKQSFEHRKPWVEKRILELGEIFACGIYSYAVMSNHLHLVVHMSPVTARGWSESEVATRWVKLYPAPNTELCEQKIVAIIEDAALVEIYRARLANLSWLMKSLSEFIARKANAEDGVSGRFWEGRFKCQALLNEKATLAAMTYVDLNPVRAKIARGVSSSGYTSVKARHRELQKDSEQANQLLRPLIGCRSLNMPAITEADYIELVDFTGRQWHAGKKGRIEASEPRALTKLGLDKNLWTNRVKGIGSGYWRVVGEVEELIDKAKELAQRTLFGTGFARILSKI